VLYFSVIVRRISCAWGLVLRFGERIVVVRSDCSPGPFAAPWAIWRFEGQS
jgi:hypothetical protein